MIVLALCVITVVRAVAANQQDQTQIERYTKNGHIKKYQIEVPGKEPITIIETAPSNSDTPAWVDLSVAAVKERDKDSVEVKDFMTDIIHDVDSHKSRCYGPSCQDGFNESAGPQGDLEEYLTEHTESSKDYRDYSKDRLEAINDLAAKLKKDKNKADRYTSYENADYDDDNGGKVYTTWNRLKVKHHKHPYDDKDGWISLEPVAWSTSKISKWKPNIKKYKPSQWTDDEYPNDDRYAMQQGSTHVYKRPSMIRPAYINNKLHVTSQEWETETPSRPSWNKPTYNYQSTWKPDDSRRPTKPNCDSNENYASDDAVFYGMSDSVVTDNRPANFPYEYEALKRPMRRPTQVVYAGPPEYDNDRDQRPPYGDGQWVLLSTTKGYRNKKRQRSLPLNLNEQNESPTITSHQAIALTVLPTDSNHTNMTTSHGGLLEVERSFKTVEESKRDMDKKKYEINEAEVATHNRPNRVIKRKIFTNAGPDGSTVLAAVGAGMVPAAMAMVVPMVLGRRKRDLKEIDDLNLRRVLHRFE